MKYYRYVCTEIFSQHENAEDYKCGIGKKGLYEQIKQNKRFYNGDQWYGAKCGNDKPLVRHNVIKRIADYKTAVIGADQLKVEFAPIGISVINEKDVKSNIYKDIISGKKHSFSKLSNIEISLATDAISQYFNICIKRLNLDEICNQALKNAYISGSGIVYAYWDCNLKTGLFADDNKKIPIMGDVAAEVINIENVDFSDPTLENVQDQEYIIISSRKTVGELIREAKANGASREQLANIKPDNEYCDDEAYYTEKATVLTKFYKVYNGDEFTIKAIRVCKNAIIKPEWDIGIKRYPIAKFNWENEMAAYGESEITNLIPNQIAINRMLTASVWSVMMMGMPIMMVNGDIITEPVTNNPGQIISFCGNSDEFDKAIKYVEPPKFTGEIDNITNGIIDKTLSLSGATDAALGTIKAQNTSAINAVKESARLPLNLIKKRYITFIEDVANIFLEFLLNMYGKRPIAQKTKDGDVWYFPFDSNRYKNLKFICEATVESNTNENIKKIADELDGLNKQEKQALVEEMQKQEKAEVGVINDG